MVKIKYLILCLSGFLGGLTSCYTEERSIVEELVPDPYDIRELSSIEYAFSKKEIKEVQSPEFKESLVNNSDQIIPITFYPYLDQGALEFRIEEGKSYFDGQECEVPVPSYENDKWSESQTISIPTIFGETTTFNPLNGNISFSINADPWKITKYGYVLTFSELTIPFVATLISRNYGDKYNFVGKLIIRVPINCDIKIKET